MNAIFTRHGRILFAVITVVIIVSFLGFLTPGFQSLFQSSSGGKTMGTIFGKNVSFEDVRDQANRNHIVYSLIYGSSLNNSALSEFASKNAFPVMCQLAAAKRRGITVSDKQIAEFVATLPRFKNAEGAFDVTRYRSYLNDTLKPNGFTASELDESVRQFLVQRELDREITDSTVVTPGEVEQFFNEFNEKLQVMAAAFDSQDYLNKVKLKDTDIRNYFDTNGDKFTIPAKLKTLLVVFDYNDPEITKEIANLITNDALKKYYEENKTQFIKVKPDQKPQIMTFEQAKSQVKNKLEDKLRREAAMHKAQLFARDVYDKVGEAEKNQLEIFTQAVNEKKLKSVMTGWFEANQSKIGKLEEPELVKQLFQIYDSVPVSNAVMGKDAVYLGFLVEKQPSRPATFSEASRQVMKELKDNQAMELARIAARETVAKLAKLTPAQRMTVIPKLTSPRFEKIDDFSVANPPYGEDGRMIAELAEDLTAGNISASTDTAKGALVVFVQKRIAPDKKDFEQNQKQVETFYRQRKVAAAKTAFSNWLQSKCTNAGE